MEYVFDLPYDLNTDVPNCAVKHAWLPAGLSTTVPACLLIDL
jgi:hypothetical protein